ncbi:MAG: DUF1385 domain-containing protein [Firmicutes bacterium]|nr:DUF1385 domain-containing protein [Bacillota bacterium]
MDLKKIFLRDACPTSIGGQAVLEGIMMKGPDRTAVAVRQPNGNIHMKVEPLKDRSRWFKIPIIRGVFIFVDALVTGTRTLLYSAEVLENAEGASGEAVEKDKMTIWLEKKFGEKGALNVMLYMSVVLAILLTVGIFIVVPTVVTHLFQHVTTNPVWLNLFEGVLRIVLFIIYIAIVSKMPDIQTTFRYHGAEHRCIHCFENNLELTPENCQQFESLHPRCGTSFLMFVMVIALLVFSLLGWPDFLFRVLSRIIFIPLIAGLSYELLRWAGKSTSPIVKVVSIPGLALQNLTTMDPNEKHLEVAIAAMKAVLDTDKPKSYIVELDPQGNPLPEITEEEGAKGAETPAGEAAAETEAPASGNLTEEKDAE